MGSWQSPGATPRARSPAPSDFIQQAMNALPVPTMGTQPVVVPAACQLIASSVPLCDGTAVFVGCAPVWNPVSVCGDVQAAKDARTTMIMRNLPNNYSRKMVLELLDSHGLAGKYNFFYLPIDFQTESNLGYAFVNLVSNADALLAQSLLGGFCNWEISSRKVLEVAWSEFSQGLDANIRRYQNSSVFHESVPEEFQP